MQTLERTENDDTLIEKLKQAANDLECAMDEENDSVDCLPENIQMSDMACRLAENCDYLSDALCSMEVVVETYETSDIDPYQLCSEDVASVIDNINKAIL